jgi:hypothetical protein
MSFSVLTTFLSSAAATTQVATVSGATSGRLLLAFVWADSSYGTNGSNDDYNITGWTKLTGDVNWVAGGSYWRVATGNSSDNVSVAFGASNSAGVFVIEFTDADTTSPVDISQLTKPASGLTATLTAGGSTSQAAEYAFAFVASYSWDSAYTSNPSWTGGFANVGTIPQHFTSGDVDTAWLSSKTLSATETLSTTVTVGDTGHETTNPIAILVSIKVASGGSSLTQESTDVTGAVDTNVIVQEHITSISDVTGSIDTAVVDLSQLQTQINEDDAGASDTIIVSVGLGISSVDDTGLTDGGLETDFNFSVEDNTGLVDTNIIDFSGGFEVITEDTTGSTDTVVMLLSMVSSFEDLIGSIDTFNIELSMTSVVEDSTGATDAVAVDLITGSLDIDYVESIGATDFAVIDFDGVSYVGSKADIIMQELIALGYTTGSIADREYSRLKAATGSDGIGKTLYDLYTLNNERPRLP